MSIKSRKQTIFSCNLTSANSSSRNGKNTTKSSHFNQNWSNLFNFQPGSINQFVHKSFLFIIFINYQMFLLHTLFFYDYYFITEISNETEAETKNVFFCLMAAMAYHYYSYYYHYYSYWNRRRIKKEERKFFIISMYL